MKKIDADLKARSFAPIYLLYGEESYLKRQYKEKLKQALISEGDSMNFSHYEGKDIRPGELIDLAETLPFFADRRLILVENSGMFKNACEEMADYLKEIAPTACLVFVEDEVDKRGKMFKRAKSAGRVAEFSRQNEKILTQWILGRLKKEQKNITRDAMQQFLQETGDDMEQIAQELEKLLCYCLDKEAIEAADVKAVCVGQTTNQIFAMIDAIGQKDQKKALTLYYDLLALKEPPMRILFLIVRQFRILLLIQSLAGKGYDDQFIAAKAGIPEFALKKNRAQAKHFTARQLREALEDCAQMEEGVKTGNLNDRMAVELLIVRYSREAGV